MTDFGRPPHRRSSPSFRRDTARDATRDAKRDAERRWPILALIVAALVLATVIDRVGTEGRSTGAVEVGGPTIPPADSLSNAWYCALGSSAPDSPNPETVVITNIGSRAVESSVTVMPGGGAASVTRAFDVPARSQRRVPVSEVLATAEPGVVVETFGGPAVVEHEVVGNDDVAVGPCATGPSESSYFAAGTTDRGAQLWLALFNPFGDDAIVDLTFLTDGGFLAPGDLQGIVVPRRTRVMVPLHDSVRRQATVATRVQTRTGRVVSELASVLESEPKGFAVTLGTPALSSRWSFPVSGLGGDVVAVTNPGASPAQVTVDIRLDGDATLEPQTVVVPSRATVTVDVGTRIPAGLGAWIDVDGRGTPIVAEQTLTRPPAGLATALGAPSSARRWAFAVGRVAADSVDSIVVANRGQRTARVSLRVVGGGSVEEPEPAVRVAPGRRAVFDLGALGVAVGAGVVVDATAPVTAARQSVGASAVTVSPGVPGPAPGGSS